MVSLILKRKLEKIYDGNIVINESGTDLRIKNDVGAEKSNTKDIAVYIKSVKGNYTYCLDLSRNGYLYNYDSTVDASNTDSDKYSKNTEENIDDNILKLFGLQ